MRTAISAIVGLGDRFLGKALPASRHSRPSAQRKVERISGHLFDTQWYGACQGLPSAEAAR